MEGKPTLASDLKKLEQAIPRQRLLVYAAFVAVVPALVVWATLMKLDRKQADETDRVQEEAAETAGEAMPGTTAAPSPGAPTPSGSDAGVSTPFANPPTDWRPATSPDGKYRMDIPPGTKIVQSEGYTYVVPESPAGALPHMAIKIATGVDKQEYKPNPANSVMMDIGLNTYWLYTWQFKTWEPFSRIVASFKVL